MRIAGPQHHRTSAAFALRLCFVNHLVSTQTRSNYRGLQSSPRRGFKATRRWTAAEGAIPCQSATLSSHLLEQPAIIINNKLQIRESEEMMAFCWLLQLCIPQKYNFGSVSRLSYMCYVMVSAVLSLMTRMGCETARAKRTRTTQPLRRAALHHSFAFGD